MNSMDFKREAVENLKNYEARKEGVRRAERQIAILKEESVALRSATTDKTPVSGSTNLREDRMINNVALRQELERGKKTTEKWVKLMDEALAALDDEDRRVLELMYIRKTKGSVDRLCEELYCEPRTVYRKRDAAVRKFAMLFYGVTEC